MQPSNDVQHLIEIMSALRDPVSGCPWDKEQTFSTIAPYTLEEAYEVADAISRQDLEDLKDELGDLLLQVVYHTQMAKEIDAFSFGDVVQAITAKMIRRHPHVFGDDDARSSGVAKGFWEKIKAEERRERAQRGGPERHGLPSHLDDVPAGLPGLARAVKLQDKAAKVGFDWNSAKYVIEKLREETDEVSAEVERSQKDSEAIADEIGDLLFTVANLARHVQVDPDDALRRANAKFVRRFGEIEKALAAKGRELEHATLEEMEQLWQGAKENEHSVAEGASS